MAQSLYLRECAERVAGVLGDDVDVSITVREDGLTFRSGSSSDSACRCHEAEALAGKGPCVDAIAHRSLQVVVSVGKEHRWDAWRAQTLSEGFVRALAVPAVVSPSADLALSLYSRVGGTWPGWMVCCAQSYAELVAAAERSRLELADVDDAATRLCDTLSAVAAIERALGALMATCGCSEPEARRSLAASSRNRKVSERALAESILRSFVSDGPGEILDGGR